MLYQQKHQELTFIVFNNYTNTINILSIKFQEALIKNNFSLAQLSMPDMMQNYSCVSAAWPVIFQQ